LRPFTKISEAVPPRLRLAACSALCALVLCLLAVPSGAVPVTAEVRVRSAATGQGTADQAVQQALVRAVREVVHRHVNAPDRTDYAGAIRRAVLERAARFVLRYAIADEHGDGEDLVVRVAAEVDSPRVLARLIEAGVPTAELAVKPRLLLVALDRAAEGVLSPLAQTLEEAGYQPRLDPRRAAPRVGDAAPAVDAQQVTTWARAAGCHLALAVSTAAAEGQATGGDALDSAPAWLEGLWSVSERTPARASLHLVAWLVDPSARISLGRLEAQGEGLGPEPAAADRAAVESGARRLGYAALERLEQSGWTLQGAPSVVQIHVSGLADPLLVEQLAAAWATVPEVRSVQLREVGRRQATWRLQVVGTGLDWETVLATARLPRGHLAWESIDLGAEPAAAETPAAPQMFRARWQGP